MAVSWSPLCILNQAVLFSLPNGSKQYRKAWFWLQTRWNYSFSQIMQNASVMLPLGVSKYSAQWMSSLFWCCESSGPSQRCLWLLVVQKLWHLWQLWWLQSVILTKNFMHSSQMMSLGVRRSQPTHVWRPLNIVIVSLASVRVYSIYKSAK